MTLRGQRPDDSPEQQPFFGEECLTTPEVAELADALDEWLRGRGRRRGS